MAGMGLITLYQQLLALQTQVLVVVAVLRGAVDQKVPQVVQAS